MNRRLTTLLRLSDFYCGCGGSSSGAKAAGVEVAHASNHWQLALDTHSHNHPDTDHYLVDLLIAMPQVFPYTPIAWFSPECTYMSLAMGQKRKSISQLDMFNATSPDPGAQRSRVTMWDVVRFSEHHRYEAVIVENVVDIKYWPPFDSWLKAMESLGYAWKICYLNSRFFHPLNGQNAIAPQNRDRIYVVFWKKGNKAPNLDFRPLAYCDTCEQNINAAQVFKKPIFPRGHYDTTGNHGQYYYACPNCTERRNGHAVAKRVEPYYFAAWNIVDWDLPITRIGDRNAPLKPKTMRRIEIGLKKFGAQPLVLDVSRTQALNNRCSLLIAPIPTQTTRQTLAFIMPQKGESEYQPMKPASEVFPTQTTSGGPALVLVPFLAEMYGGGDLRPITEPVNTVTSGGIKTGLVMPPAFINTYYSRDDTQSSMIAPAPVVVGDNRLALVVMPQTPFISSYYSGSDILHGVQDPMATLSTKERHALVLPEVSIEDCYYRMFVPNECKLAQGFGQNYKILGSNKHQVKQIGNAVSTTPAEFLVKAVAESFS